MKSVIFLWSIVLLFLANSTFGQEDRIPTTYFGCYSAPFGDEGSGNEINYCFGLNGDPTSVYKEIFSQVRYATYYKVVSFDQQSGILVLKSERMILVEEEDISIEDDSSGILEIRLVKRGNALVIRDENFIDADIIKSNSLEFQLLNRNGLPTKFK